MNVRERLLEKTFVSKTFKNPFAPPRLVAMTVEEFFQADDGKSVLNLGCGFGDIAPCYSDCCSCVGIDSNEAYIMESRKRNSSNGAQFIVADISDPEVLAREPFDLVILTGVLHHLPSSHVAQIATAARNQVSSSGRFVADRGRYVRDTDGYVSVLNSGFSKVDAKVGNGRLRIPYSHVVLTCNL